MATDNERARSHKSERDWNKVGAIAGITGVLINSVLGFGTLFLTWWLYRKSSPQPADGTAPMTIPWWMPILIASAMIGTGLLQYRSAILSRHTPPDHPTRKPSLEIAEERTARERLYEFFRMCAHDLYRDASIFANSVETKLGSEDDLRGCLAGTLKVYRQRDFMARFTTLTALMPPHPEASGKEPLHNVEMAFGVFIQSYDDWARWTQKAALLVPLDIENDQFYLEWNKSDCEFFRRLKETTAVAGLGWLNQQTAGLQHNAFRLRNLNQ